MENLESLYTLIGPAGVALIFVALYALYVSVWLVAYLNRVWKNFRRDFLDLESGKDRCLRNIDPGTANPLIRIIYDIVATHGSHSDDIRAEVAYLFHRNFKRVSNGLVWLKLISVISPLLGLLGTVFGMVEVFKTLSFTEVPSTELLAAGIWQAMVYYGLMLKVRGFHIEAVEHSYRALEIMNRLRGKNNPHAIDDEEE